ncbi:hypothetical protein GCM10028818_05370 [Spirosoma horti]
MKNILLEERNYWIKIIMNVDTYNVKKFIWLMRFVPEYRSIYYFRIKYPFSTILKLLAKGRESLYINMSPDKVGIGLVIQHGFSTIIEAKKIGKKCQIWQNVTIGTNISHSGNKATIGDNVKISAGAIIIGNIFIGNNVTIGAGSVVTKSVPDNCVVVGNPAYIVKKNGNKVILPL